jgi:putative tryptophan/tyrosine transport system substrate-binding protein
MQRREFITILGGAAATWPLAALAQQSAKQHRIALLHPAIPAALISEDIFWRAFLAELRRLGYVEGENLVVERYSAEGHHERYADLAQEIVTRHPDVIVTSTNLMVIAVTAATNTIPVVAIMFDPLKAGLVISLARPGGNLTGINLGVGVEIWGKLLQILKEAIPSAATVAFMGRREDWEGQVGQVLRDVGGRLGISLTGILPREGTPSEFERVFAAMARQRPDAVLVSAEGDQYAHRQLIVELAEKNRLPAIYAIGGYVERGGLMAYVADLAEARHRLADAVHQILSGAKPSDIPIYQTTKFQLIINLKAANAIGLTFPPALLTRADVVIE